MGRTICRDRKEATLSMRQLDFPLSETDLGQWVSTHPQNVRVGLGQSSEEMKSDQGTIAENNSSTVCAECQMRGADCRG